LVEDGGNWKVAGVVNIGRHQMKNELVKGQIKRKWKSFKCLALHTPYSTTHYF
jgi:hypothetical protein